MFEFYQKNRRIINKILFYLVFIVGIYIFVVFLFDYIAPFFIAFLISIALEPVVQLAHKRFKIGRGLLAMFCVLLIIALSIVLGTNLVNRIIQEGQGLIKTLPAYVNEVSAALANLESQYANVFEFFPDTYEISLVDFSKPLVQVLTSNVGLAVTSGSQSVVRVVPTVVMFIVLCSISTFFLIKDKPMITEVFVRKCPKFLLNSYQVSKKGLFKALGGYVRAQLILMSITATICITGLAITGYPYALFVGLLIAIVDALPIFGSGFVLWPWAAFQLITGHFGEGISLLVIYGTIFLTRQTLEPKVLGTQIGVHPLITLMAMYIGLKVFGVFGLFIGPIIVVTIKTLNEAEFV